MKVFRTRGLITLPEVSVPGAQIGLTSAFEALAEALSAAVQVIGWRWPGSAALETRRCVAGLLAPRVICRYRQGLMTAWLMFAPATISNMSRISCGRS